MRIDGASFRRIGLHVKLIRNAVTVCIIQYRLGQFHVTGSIDLVLT